MNRPATPHATTVLYAVTDEDGKLCADAVQETPVETQIATCGPLRRFV